MQPNHLPEKGEDIDACLAANQALDNVINSVVASDKRMVEAPSEVVEVITPGAAAISATSGLRAIGDVNGGTTLEQTTTELIPVIPTQDLDHALEAVLAFYGWQHLEAQKVAGDVYSVGGAEFQIRCESAVTADQAGSGTPYHLSASSDGGQTWESVASLVRSRRLHKVVRTQPMAPSLESLEDKSSSENFASQAPISLADLARMPSRTLSGSGLGEYQQHSGRSGTPPGRHDSPGGSGYNAYSGPSYGGNSPKHGVDMFGRSPHTGVAPLPLGPDGLPTHRHDGLPNFNNAFPTYFSALSGPTHYYNQFRIPDRQT